MTEDEQAEQLAIEMHLKDAPEHVSLLLQNYVNLKLGCDLDLDTIKTMFSDEMHPWGYFKDYTYTATKPANLDTGDRETINCWLWARVMGQIFPYMMTEEDIRDLHAKLNHPELTSRLHSFSKVIQHGNHLQRTRAMFEMPVECLEMPERVKMKGSQYVLDAIKEILIDNQALLETKIKEKAKTAENIDNSEKT